MELTSKWPRKNMTLHPDVAELLNRVAEIEDVAAWRVLDALVRLGVEVVLSSLTNEVRVPGYFAKQYFEDAGLDEEQIAKVFEVVMKMVL